MPFPLDPIVTPRCTPAGNAPSIAMARATVSVIAIVVAIATSARAQYGISPYHAGPPDVRNPYDRARDGGNVDQWTRLLESPDPKDRLRAVEDLGQSLDPHAVTPP